MKIDAVHPSWSEMQQAWDLPNALLGGTRAMRKKGSTYLPPNKGEDDELYSARLIRNVLFGGYRETLRRLSAKPFCKPVTLKGVEDMEWIDRLTKDCDSCGSNLTTWARARYFDATHYGAVHAIVEFPRTPAEFGQQEARGIVRPYFVVVDPIALRYWAHDKDDQLVDIRIHGMKEVVTGDGIERVATITRWTPEDVSFFEQVNNVWIQTGEPRQHNFGRIPLRTLQFNRTGVMTSEPCLEDLAFQNLRHWQSSSEHQTQLSFSRRSALLLTGLSKDEKDAPIYFGGGAVIRLTDHDAKGTILEHSGAAIGASREDLLDTEERMVWLGLQPLMSRSGTQTATAHVINADGSHSDAQSWAMALGIWLTELIRDAAGHLKAELPKDFRAEVFTEFGLSAAKQQDLDTLLKSRMAGEITRATFLAEIKRRGVLSESVDTEKEAESAATESPTGETLPIPGEHEEDDHE